MIALMKAFHCFEPKERVSSCVPLMASLTTYEVYFGEEEEGEKEGGDEGTPESKVSLNVARKLKEGIRCGCHCSIMYGGEFLYLLTVS